MATKSELNEWVALCKQGDPKAQKQIFKIYFHYILNICRGYTRNEDAAHDMTQETFIKIFNKISSHTTSGGFSAWVTTISKRTAIDYLRSNNKKFEEYQEYTHSNLEDLSYYEIHNNELDEERKIEMIHEAANELAPSYRKVFERFAFKEMKHKDIAEELGINISTSKTNYMKAKANIAKILKKKLGDEIL
jgi:RNA polymerase sigma-70 factor (ECF subfamily)